MEIMMKCSEVPKNSIVFNEFKKVDYIDSYQISKSTDDDIEQISAQILKLPPWLNFLMNIRDVMVQPFGLKTNKGKKPGEIIFTKIAQNENELVMGENDRHLNFRVSVLVDRLSSLIYVTTLVHYNNKAGKIYFLFVKPFHKMLVRSVLKRYEDKVMKNIF
jgi:hypothetical protein